MRYRPSVPYNWQTSLYSMACCLLANQGFKKFSVEGISIIVVKAGSGFPSVSLIATSSPPFGRGAAPGKRSDVTDRDYGASISS